MKTLPFLDLARSIYAIPVRAGGLLQSPFLLVVRLYWGWQFFQTGTAKLHDVPTFVEHFKDWGVPFPELNVYLAGLTEAGCGLLLLAGLASRFISIPLVFTMIVAYLTAEKEALHAIFSDPDKFVSAAPFQYMFAAILVFVFGPGLFSLDHLIGRQLNSEEAKASATPAHT